MARCNLIPLMVGLLPAVFLPMAVAQVEGGLGMPISTTVVVTFPDRGTSFLPGPDAEATLADAKGAALVAIRGRTSTSVASAKDESRALARALSARAYLVAHGVSPLKITLNYASAADFVADNTTVDGRQQNQRVEVDLIYVPNAAGVRAWLSQSPLQ